MKKIFITSIYLGSLIDIPYIIKEPILHKIKYKKEKEIKPNKTFFLKNKRNIINQPKRIKK